MGYNSSSFSLETSDVVGFTEAQRLSVELQLCISIVTEGPLEYKNLRYPRYKNFYGYCQLMSGAFVVESKPIEYLNQQIYHFQQSSTDINQGVACGFKKVLESQSPPVLAQVTVYLLRQIITSVRFRFHPGVLANCLINWHFVEQLCDENLVAPPPEQGNPPSPNNSGYNPGDRPAEQPRDAKDNSPNDGTDKLPGQNNPPKPAGGEGINKSWKIILGYYDAVPQFRTSKYDTEVTDPTATVSALYTMVPGSERQDGRTDKFLTVYVNGNPRVTEASGGDLQTISIYFGL